MEVEGPVLVVLTEDDANAALSFRNLPEVSGRADEYGVYELLRAREVVFSRAATPGSSGGEQMDPHQVIIRPVISEKSYNLIESEGSTPSRSTGGRTRTRSSAPSKAPST